MDQQLYQNPVTLLEKTYALSKVIHIIQYPKSRSNSAKQKTEQLQLLDAIALLLVTKAKSNAAVSLERRTGEVVFNWAKDNAVTLEDQEHLSNLVDIATSDNPSDDRVEGVLTSVMETCRHAVFSRIENLKTAIKKNGSLLSNITNTPNQVGWRQYLDTHLAEYFDVESAVDLVLAYFHCLPELEVDALSAAQLEILVTVASVIGSYDQIEEVLRDPTIMKRLRLVGDYLGACERVVGSVDQNRELNIRFMAVDVAAQIKTRLPADCSVIFNRLATEGGLDATIDASQLKAAYPGAEIPGPETMTSPERQIMITSSVHAECSVGLHMLLIERRLWKNIEIGTSEGSCWFCVQYLGLLQQKYVVTLPTTHSHGNTQPSWMLPPTCLELLEIHQGLERKVTEALEEIIKHTTRRKCDGSEKEIDEHSGEEVRVGMHEYDFYHVGMGARAA